MGHYESKNPQQSSGEKNDTTAESMEVEKLTDSIAIPGFSLQQQVFTSKREGIL